MFRAVCAIDRRSHSWRNPEFLIPDRSCFLLGPRGTDKSTWLRDRLSDALYLDLLDPALNRSLTARPERLRELLAGCPGWGVIDEIQRIPDLLSVVQAMVQVPSPPPPSGAHSFHFERIFGSSWR